MSLPWGDGGGAGGLHDLLHGAGEGGADLQFLSRGVGGEDHVHPCLGVPGGGGEVIGENVKPCVGADLVDVRDFEGIPLEVGLQVQVGGADDGGTVLQEAQGLEVGGGGPEHPVGDHQPQGGSPVAMTK